MKVIKKDFVLSELKQDLEAIRLTDCEEHMISEDYKRGVIAGIKTAIKTVKRIV